MPLPPASSPHRRKYERRMMFCDNCKERTLTERETMRVGCFNALLAIATAGGWLLFLILWKAKDPREEHCTKCGESRWV